MSDRPWWITALKWALWAAIMSLVMGWLGRSRFRTRPLSDARRLAHPPSTLILGLAGSAFFAGHRSPVERLRQPDDHMVDHRDLRGFRAPVRHLVIDYFAARHEVSAEGLSYRKLAGTRKYLRWRELRDVRYAPVMKWFRLETEAGDVARISVMLMGLPEFARLLLEHAPADAIEPGTLDILRAIAEGAPPSVWS